MGQTTHVANASDQEIFVMCDGDRTLITDASASLSAKGFSASASMKQQVYHIATSAGFTRINPRQVLPFHPKNNGTVYISIFTLQGGKLVLVCQAYPRDADHSVIVGADNHVYATQYDRIWVDMNGRAH